MSQQKFKTKKIEKENNKTNYREGKNLTDAKEVEQFFSDKIETPQKRNHPILIWVFCLIFSATISFLFCVLFVTGQFSRVGFLEFLSIQNYLPENQVVVEKQEKITVVEDKKYQSSFESTLNSVVGIYSGGSQKSTQGYLNFPAEKYLGNGSILTNDGWIITSNDIIPTQGDYSIIYGNNKIYPVVEQIFFQKQGLVFLKIEADNLPVVDFASKNDTQISSKVYLLSGKNNYNKKFASDKVSTLNFKISDRTVRDTEDVYIFYQLEKNHPKEFLGTTVFNLNKQIVGVLTQYNDEQYIIPSYYLKKVFNQLITLGKFTPSYLGIEYIDLADTIMPNMPQSGSLVTEISNQSPLQENQLQEGDIILELNDEPLNQQNNLTSLIQTYRPGDKIYFKLQKPDKTEVEIETELIAK